MIFSLFITINYDQNKCENLVPYATSGSLLSATGLCDICYKSGTSALVPRLQINYFLTGCNKSNRRGKSFPGFDLTSAVAKKTTRISDPSVF